MKWIVGGIEGDTIKALVHWFLDDKAAFCNGIRLLDSVGDMDGVQSLNNWCSNLVDPCSFAYACCRKHHD